jgi:hypothetical protein
MNLIEIIVTVCAVSQPSHCEDKHLQFAAEISPQQCVMTAQPYIAKWIGEHPQWTPVRWRCEYPGTGERRANARGAADQT